MITLLIMIFMENDQSLKEKMFLIRRQGKSMKLKIICIHCQDMQGLTNVIFQVKLSKQRVH